MCDSDTDGVHVTGRVGTPVTLDRATLETFPQSTSHDSFLCASGTRWDGYWRGVSLLDLLDFADVSGDTTHIQVVGHDDYAACVSILDATSGLLALFQSKSNEDDLRPCRPRFVTGGVEAPRTVKDVSEIRALQLQDGERPEEHE
ncbi:molybdopterin-dependent oxidoreductase [Haladaptatus sp. NG-WS-4]